MTESNVLLQMAMDTMRRTETSDTHYTNPRLMHGILGLADEAGELVSTLKSSLYYGEPFDKVNLIEELGDSWFYFTLMVDELAILFGISGENMFEVIAHTNKMKLQTRYEAGNYTEEQAKNRDLKKERAVMVAVIKGMIDKRKINNGKEKEDSKKTE